LKALRPARSVSINSFAAAFASMFQTCLAASKESIRFLPFSWPMSAFAVDFVRLVLTFGMYRKIVVENSHFTNYKELRADIS
jgi:hypothetical protein